MRVLVIGHSHITAIYQAFRSSVIDDLDKHTFEFIHMSNSGFKSLFHQQSNPQYQEELGKFQRLIADTDIIFTSIQGNVHSELGLVNHPQPFDFIFDQFDKPQSDNEAQFIPRPIMFAKMEEMTQLFKGISEILADLNVNNLPVFQLESPPIVPSAAHIKQFPKGFADRIERFGISPARVRQNLWRLQSELVKGYCNLAGFGFVPVPKQSLDSKCFLKKEYWPEDPNHANPAYGNLVLEDILDLIISLDKTTD